VSIVVSYVSSVLFVYCVLFVCCGVLFVCCVLLYNQCHRVKTHLQLINITLHILSSLKLLKEFVWPAYLVLCVYARIYLSISDFCSTHQK
jgi:hypothetical protein